LRGGGKKLQQQGHESVQRSLDNVGQLQQKYNNKNGEKTPNQIQQQLTMMMQRQKAKERERYTNIQKLNSHHEKRSKLIVMMFFKLTLGLWSGRVWDGEGEGKRRYIVYP